MVSAAEDSFRLAGQGLAEDREAFNRNVPLRYHVTHFPIATVAGYLIEVLNVPVQNSMGQVELAAGKVDHRLQRFRVVVGAMPVAADQRTGRAVDDVGYGRLGVTL